MSDTVGFDSMGDQALGHQFIRVMGRRPGPEDLLRYRQAHSGLALRLPGRLRRRAARLIVRL
jgi:hypothetical protein